MSRAVVLALFALALLATGCSRTVELEAVPDLPPPLDPFEQVDGVAEVTEGAAAGAFPRPFDGWVAEGTALTVWWETGPPPCHVFDRVEVDETPTSVQVTVHEGYDPSVDIDDLACPGEVWVVRSTVTLDSPLSGRDVLDGVTGEQVAPRALPG